MQKLGVIAIALVPCLAAGCGGTRTIVRTTTVTTSVTPAATGDQRVYGQIRSIAREGNRYLVRIDPDWFVSGVTANVAQAQDEHRACRPFACPPVANDSTVVDEGSRTLTYVLPAAARGTVLVRSTGTRTITAAELAQLVAHRSPIKLFEPLRSGIWLLVHIDTVRTFAQQYVP